MNKIKRHIPSFVDHDPEDRVEVEFDTLEQLLSIEWVHRWCVTTIPLGERLLRFSMSERTVGSVCHLMAEMKDGSFWVIGRLDKPIPELPVWNYDECQARKESYQASIQEGSGTS